MYTCTFLALRCTSSSIILRGVGYTATYTLLTTSKTRPFGKDEWITIDFRQYGARRATK